MWLSTLMSDHYDNWSDNEAIDTFSSAQTQGLAHPVACHGASVARFPDRTLQALWKAWLQMLERTRSWAQVLSVGQSKRGVPPDGLCAVSLLFTGQRVARQLSSGSRDSRRDLPNQPGTAAPSRTPIRRASIGARSRKHTGCRSRGTAGRQYARSLAGERLGCRLDTGGLR